MRRARVQGTHQRYRKILKYLFSLSFSCRLKITQKKNQLIAFLFLTR
jgi:hypothetical protein